MDDRAPGSPKPQTCILKVDVNCLGCQNKVRKTLERVDEVQSVHIDPEDQKVTILSTKHPQTLIDLLAKAGKKAQIMSPPVPEPQKVVNKAQYTPSSSTTITSLPATQSLYNWIHPEQIQELSNNQKLKKLEIISSTNVVFTYKHQQVEGGNLSNETNMITKQRNHENNDDNQVNNINRENNLHGPQREEKIVNVPSYPSPKLVDTRGEIKIDVFSDSNLNEFIGSDAGASSSSAKHDIRDKYNTTPMTKDKDSYKPKNDVFHDANENEFIGSTAGASSYFVKHDIHDESNTKLRTKDKESHKQMQDHTNVSCCDKLMRLIGMM